MLQLLLAVLAISIVSVSGYGLIEQMHLQQVMSDQRENIRRLDVASEAIQGRLASVAGRDGVFGPLPVDPTGSVTWSTMPVGSGAVNRTVAGVPFLYCPLSALGSVGTANRQVSSGGGSYGIEADANVVVGSDLAIPAALVEYKPIAYIIAAGYGRTAPPSCDAVGIRNGKPFVDGGLVRVVGVPSGTNGMGALSRETADIFVSASGSGSGRSANDATSVSTALRHWLTYHPSSMTIHVIGTVGVSDGGLWSDFSNSMAGSSAKLAIVGVPGGSSLPEIDTPGAPLQASSSLTLSDVALPGAMVTVPKGATLNVSGQVVLSGAADGIRAAGDVSLSGATITGGASSGAAVHLLDGSRLTSSGSRIVSPGYGLASDGSWSISTVGGASTVVRGAMCWVSLGNDVAFAPGAVAEGPGASSSVADDVDDPEPAVVADDPASVAVHNEWAARQPARDLRRRARQVNHSAFQCINS